MKIEDRNLLKSAANAVGFTFHDDSDGYGELPALYLNIPGEEFRLQKWNPLDDDADAFRLAAALHMEVAFHASYVSVTGSYGPNTEQYSPAQDKLAAARRAIVRTAAEEDASIPF